MTYWDTIKYFTYCEYCKNRFEVTNNEFHRKIFCSDKCINEAFKELKRKDTER